jgi:hypothetical protein
LLNDSISQLTPGQEPPTRQHDPDEDQRQPNRPRVAGILTNSQPEESHGDRQRRNERRSEYDKASHRSILDGNGPRAFLPAQVDHGREPAARNHPCNDVRIPA